MPIILGLPIKETRATDITLRCITNEVQHLRGLLILCSPFLYYFRQRFGSLVLAFARPPPRLAQPCHCLVKYEAALPRPAYIATPNVAVVDWNSYLYDETWVVISSLYFTDGRAEDSARIAQSGEPWRPLTKLIIKENPCVKKLSPQNLYYWQEEGQHTGKNTPKFRMIPRLEEIKEGA